MAAEFELYEDDVGPRGVLSGASKAATTGSMLIPQRVTPRRRARRRSTMSNALPRRHPSTSRRSEAWALRQRGAVFGSAVSV